MKQRAVTTTGCFAEGIHPTMLKAAVEAKAEGICHPILLGNDERIEKLAKELDLSLEGIEIINLRHDREAERRERYARILSEKRARQGANLQESNDKMFERNYFGMMMVETGEADAFITGLYTKYSNTIKVAKEVIGIRLSTSTSARCTSSTPRKVRTSLPIRSSTAIPMQKH